MKHFFTKYTEIIEKEIEKEGYRIGSPKFFIDNRCCIPESTEAGRILPRFNVKQQIACPAGTLEIESTGELPVRLKDIIRGYALYSDRGIQGKLSREYEKFGLVSLASYLPRHPKLKNPSMLILLDYLDNESHSPQFDFPDLPISENPNVYSAFKAFDRIPFTKALEGMMRLASKKITLEELTEENKKIERIYFPWLKSPKK